MDACLCTECASVAEILPRVKGGIAWLQVVEQQVQGEEPAGAELVEARLTNLLIHPNIVITHKTISRTREVRLLPAPDCCSSLYNHSDLWECNPLLWCCAMQAANVQDACNVCVYRCMRYYAVCLQSAGRSLASRTMHVQSG